jgi:arginine decarboxylase
MMSAASIAGRLAGVDHPLMTSPTVIDTRSPFTTALEEALARTVANFSTPGHKRSSLVSDDPGLMRDLPLLCGVEDQNLSRDLLGQAERAAARAWGADLTRFSVQGSTGANLATALAVTGPDEPVIVARTSHKSVLAGLVLSGARPHWVFPQISEQTGLALGIPVAEVEIALAVEPDATAVWLPDPSYIGICSDLTALATLAHPRGIPLIVDQAWGAHFGFHPSVPKNALALGADVSVISAHKTITSFTQGAMLHVAGPAIAHDKMRTAFDLVHTTSPSGVILASLDRSRALMEDHGKRLLGAALLLADELRSGLRALPGVGCLDDTARGLGWQTDPLKIAIDVSGTGISGFELDRRLQGDGIQLLMADGVQLVPLLTVADTSRKIETLLDALARALEWCQHRGDRSWPLAEASIAWRVRPTTAMTPRTAFLAAHERVSWRNAAGRVASEMIVPYPPGVPAVAPGEVLTEALINGLRQEAVAGTRILGPTDRSLESFVVVAR